MSPLRIVVAILGFAGGALFCLAFLASFVSPGFVERTAKALIRAEVERRVEVSVASLDGTRIAGIARRISSRNAVAAGQLRHQVSEGLPGKIAEVIGEMSRLDCDCRKQVERTIAGGWEWRITALSKVNERLTALIRTQYMEVTEKLTREFRVFTGANALVLLVLGVAAIVRKRAGLHLVPAASVLLCASLFVAYFYLFRQNWLHTIVFSEYVGLGYFAYLGLAFAFLSDLVFNRARVTTWMLNMVLQVVGSAIRVAPC
jgi:hypothetical protein